MFLLFLEILSPSECSYCLNSHAHLDSGFFFLVAKIYSWQEVFHSLIWKNSSQGKEEFFHPRDHESVAWCSELLPTNFIQDFSFQGPLYYTVLGIGCCCFLSQLLWQKCKRNFSWKMTVSLEVIEAYFGARNLWVEADPSSDRPQSI